MNRKLLSTLATLVAVISIPAAVVYNSSQAAGQGQPGIQAPPPAVEQTRYPEVSVMTVSRDDYQASVSGFGEATSRFQLALTTEVGGRVTGLSDRFSSSRLVSKGTELARLDATSYAQALAAAKATLAEAELALLEEERQGQQARHEWERSGLTGEPDSPLVLREPQLQAAQAAVSEARQQVQSAQRDLDSTRIRAPFDALVISREIQPGSYLQAGGQVATLYSTDRVEVSVPLSASQWQSLPATETLADASWAVTLKSADSKGQWQGYVERVARHLDPESRQRSLVVVVEDPLGREHPLYPGTFVQASIAGRLQQGLWQLPASAITQDGAFWYVDDKDQLARITADIAFEDGRHSYVVPPRELEAADIVIRPLSSYLVGMRVDRRTETSS